MSPVLRPIARAAAVAIVVLGLTVSGAAASHAASPMRPGGHSSHSFGSCAHQGERNGLRPQILINDPGVVPSSSATTCRR